MKTMKLFGLVAAVVCLLALAGCGGQSGGEAGYTKEQVQELLDSGAFTDVLDELDCDTAWALYGLEEAGLSREDLTDGVIYRSAGATCEELSLLIFADSGAAKTAQGALESYLQSREQPGLPPRRDPEAGGCGPAAGGKHRAAGSFRRYPGGGGAAGIRKFGPVDGSPPAGLFAVPLRAGRTLPLFRFLCRPGLAGGFYFAPLNRKRLEGW